MSRDYSVRSGIRVFGAIAPIIPGHEPALRAHLRSLRDDSPFASVSGIHFARWVVIPQFPYDGHPQKPDVLTCQYLLFSACFDEEPLDGFLGRLRDELGAAADAVWGHCVGYRRQRDLPRYLLHNQLRPRAVYVQPPGGTVTRIRDALTLHARLVRFVLGHQRETDARTLRRAWTDEFGSRAEMPAAVR